MEFLTLLITLLLGLLGGFFLAKPPLKSRKAKENVPEEKKEEKKEEVKEGVKEDGVERKRSFSGAVDILSPNSVVTKPTPWASNSYTSNVPVTPMKERSDSYDMPEHNPNAVFSPIDVPPPLDDEMKSPFLKNVEAPKDSHANPYHLDLNNSVFNEKRSSTPIKPGFAQPSVGRRRALVIVSLNLPIQAYKKEGKWVVEWDKPRSDHMTPSMQWLKESVDVTWVGWPGVFVPKHEEDDFSELLEKFNCRPVFLSVELHSKFFDKCCKEMLWPLLHYRMPTSDISTDWDMAYQAYTTANMIFAKQVSSMIESDDDFIWVHNYHLFLVPSFLRKKFPRAKVGFFLHTPFPTSDSFRCLPHRANILRGVLCADLIGFHTYDYARHFLSATKRILDLEVETLPGGSLGVTCNGRAVCIRISHVGVAADIYQNVHKLALADGRAKEIQDEHFGRSIILGFNECDSVKQPLLLFNAFERFLASHPELRKSVVMIAIITGSFNSKKEQLVIRESIMEIVASIKAKYGVQVLQVIEPEDGKLSIDFNELVAYYRAATVGLFTSHWDGLNLFPFEFTACQDESKPGALIISEFMGCVRSLSGVVRINPWRLEEVSDAIVSALSMDLEERKANHRRRYRYVMNHTLESWAHGFLSDLEKSAEYADDLNLVQVGWGSNVSLIGLRKNFHHLNPDDINVHFRRAHRRILIFDYDGTLTSETDRYLCRPNESLLNQLQILCNDERNIVFILSGRERKVLVDWFSSIKNLGLAPEKGCYIRWPGSAQWQMTHNVNAHDWKPIALGLIEQYTDRTDGSYIEDKESAIVWHFEAADPEYGRMQSSELSKFLMNVLSPFHVEVVRYDYNRILEVKPKGINKGVTTKAILHRLAKQMQHEIKNSSIKTPFFIMCVGDDKSDEDMFVALNNDSPILQELAIPIPDEFVSTSVSNQSMMLPMVYTCCVGLKPSNASHYLHDPQEVLAILSSFANTTSFSNREDDHHLSLLSTNIPVHDHHHNFSAEPAFLNSTLDRSHNHNNEPERRSSLNLGTSSGMSSNTSLGSKSLMRSGKGGVNNLAALASAAGVR